MLRFCCLSDTYLSFAVYWNVEPVEEFLGVVAPTQGRKSRGAQGDVSQNIERGTVIRHVPQIWRRFCFSFSWPVII